MRKILESSGWENKETKEGLEHQIPLSSEKFYYEEDNDISRLYVKRKYSNSKLWGAKKLEIEGTWIEIGDYLAENGLINEGEYNRAKQKFLNQKRKEELEKQRALKLERMNKIERLIHRLGNNLVSATKKISALSIILIGSYTTYQYIENEVEPGALYTYIKDNIGNYDLKELVANSSVNSLTYSQMRNLDYAIENNQVAELLEQIENKPENIHYISVLKENLNKKQN